MEGCSMRLRQHQRGVTVIGFLLIAVLVGLVGYGAIRLFPLYMTQLTIRELMADLKTENDDNGASPKRLMTAIGKRLDVNGIEYPKVQDFVITKTEEGFLVEVDYEDRVPFIGNISLLATFDNAVEIRK
jgi:prepilin signal peptidase PulO-like enzyme (type II secretory pathway)